MNIHRIYCQVYACCCFVTVCLGALLVANTGHAQDERVQYFPRKVDYPKAIPNKENVWIFVMAGQSNMAGRGMVEPRDTVSNDRILTINAANEIILAKEPLHFYEPNLTGLDCGISFANTLLHDIGKDVSILLIPAAVGGSSSKQWLGDSLHRNVKLMSNFRQRIASIEKFGTIQGILWHQGESDTDDVNLPGYEERLKRIFARLRESCNGSPDLPILIGELGSFSENQDRWNAINTAIHKYAKSDRNAFVVATGDLKAKSDKIHFDSDSQREMGKRMAEAFLKMTK